MGDIWPEFDPPPDARRALLHAILQVIDELPEADLLLGVTPERVGHHMDYSASSVRYQFARQFGSPARDSGAPLSASSEASPHATTTTQTHAAAPGAGGGARAKWSFDRAQVLDALLDEIERRVLQTTETVAQLYLDAIDESVLCGTLAPLVAVVTDDLDAYAPGASSSPTNVSERAYLLAVTACDRSSSVGRRLRALRAQELELHYPVFRRLMVVTGRRLQDGCSLRELATAAAHLAEGASLERRYRAPTANADRVTAHGMFAIFLGMTEPNPAASAAPLASVRCPPAP